MTVKHLQSVQRQQLNMAIQTDPSVIHKFKTGFVECAEEVNRYVSQLDGVETSVRQSLTAHLSNCATSLEQIGSMTNFNNGYRNPMAAASHNTLFNGASAALPATVPAATALFPALPQDLNNNSNITAATGTTAPIQLGGVQLIPSRLPTGEFALIVPNSGAPNAASLLGGGVANVGSSFAGNWSATAAHKPNVLQPTAAAPAQDFAASFQQRFSAFSAPNVSLPSKQLPLTAGSNVSSFNTAVASSFHAAANNLHHNSTASSSPPLSPISSVSSHGEDSSNMQHNSSDYIGSRSATPPPPEASANNFSGVFSTPPSSAESSFSSNLSHSTTNLQQHQVSSTSGYSSALNSSSELNSSGNSLKRSLTESVNESGDSLEQSSTKKFAAGNQSTWRPW